MKRTFLHSSNFFAIENVKWHFELWYTLRKPFSILHVHTAARTWFRSVFVVVVGVVVADSRNHSFYFLERKSLPSPSFHSTRQTHTERVPHWQNWHSVAFALLGMVHLRCCIISRGKATCVNSGKPKTSSPTHTHQLAHFIMPSERIYLLGLNKSLQDLSSVTTHGACTRTYSNNYSHQCSCGRQRFSFCSTPQRPKSSSDELRWFFHVSISWCAHGCAVPLIVHRWHIDTVNMRYHLFCFCIGDWQLNSRQQIVSNEAINWLKLPWV